MGDVMAQPNPPCDRRLSRQDRRHGRLWGLLTAAAALALGLPLALPDDFLRATSRELPAREKEALAARVSELGNPDPLVRHRAVCRLAAIGRPALPALLEVLERGSDPKLVRNGCLALGAMGDATALALLEKWFLAENPGEEVARAALFALARGRAASPELSEKLRRLAVDAPLATVRESALLCAGALKVAGLPDILKNELQSERSARVRGCMLIALAEAGDIQAAPLIAKLLAARTTRDEKLRRAALYAAARLAEPTLREPLLAFEADGHEAAPFAVALGALPDARATALLGELLLHERDHVAVAAQSLAHQQTAEAKGWLDRALRGDFSETVRAAAALAVADLTDQQRFLPPLREMATSHTPGPAKAAALLALARIGDGDAAPAVAEALPSWRELAPIENGLLLCAITLGRPASQLLPEARRVPVAALCREIDDVLAERSDPRLLRERVAVGLTAGRADWSLSLDDLRDFVIRDLLELDKIVFAELRKVDENDGTGTPPPSPPSVPPGSAPGDGGGADDGGSPPPADGGDSSSPPPAPPTGGSSLPTARRGKQDTARFELDLKLWLADFPPFQRAEPFGR